MLDVLITDGLRGAEAACTQAWPGTRIQRCLVHVQRILLVAHSQGGLSSVLWLNSQRPHHVGQLEYRS